MFAWADLPLAHIKMLRNEHKPGNMAVLVQAPRTGLRTLEDALEQSSTAALAAYRQSSPGAPP